MLVVILPGYSPKNEEEGQHIADYLSEKDMSVLFHTWPHWDDETIQFNADTEAQAVVDAIEESGEEEIAFVAKSIGSLVCMKVLELLNEETEVNTVILMGIPLNDLHASEVAIYKRALADYGGDVSLIQNELDPHAELSKVRDLVEEFEPFEEIKIGVEDHRYDYPNDVYEILRDYVDDMEELEEDEDIEV